jgi:hypothetical protein
MGDINCPHCNTELNINHDDGLGCFETCKDEMQCNECEQNFILTTYISYHYEAHKSDCSAALKEGE